MTFRLSAIAMAAALPCTAALGQTRGGSGMRVVVPTVVVRGAPAVDSALATRQLGAIRIAARHNEFPTIDSVAATVILRIDDREVARQSSTTPRSLRFDSVGAGRYTMSVGSIGYAPFRLEIEVIPGCLLEIEALLARMPVGIDPPAPGPSRVTVTTCERKR
jgi:hypothetical protein